MIKGERIYHEITFSAKVIAKERGITHHQFNWWLDLVPYKRRLIAHLKGGVL